MAAGVMLGLGIAVVGGGVAFAGDDAGSGAPAVTVPGVVTNYRVNTPTLPQIPIQVGPVAPSSPVQPGGGVVTADEWNWT
jgi:hypothetical protein